MRSLYAALLGIAVAGVPLAGQQAGGKKAPGEGENIALTRQLRMVSTFARRIEIAEAGEEADVRTNTEKLGAVLENAAARLDELAKAVDSTQVAKIAAVRKYLAEARGNYEALKTEVAKSPMQLKAARTRARSVREQSEAAEEAHAKMLAKPTTPPGP